MFLVDPNSPASRLRAHKIFFFLGGDLCVSRLPGHNSVPIHPPSPKMRKQEIGESFVVASRWLPMPDGAISFPGYLSFLESGSDELSVGA